MKGRSLILSTLCALTAVAAPAQEPIALPDNSLQGRLLFESRQCHQCHGITGSEQGIGPALGGGHFSGSFLDLGAALWNHAPGMSAGFEATSLHWPELSPGEVTKLLAFLYFIDYLGRPGDPAAGGEIFQRGGCSACHSVGGSAATVGPDLAELQRFASPLFIGQAIWNHGPSMLASMRARQISPPRFQEGDLADLSAFIRQKSAGSLQERVLLAPGNPNRGRDLFADKGCALCHGEEARGGDGGPDLSRTDLHRSAEGLAGTMWNHALEMNETMHQLGVGWPRLTTPELADVVAFLYFLPFTDLPGSPQRGAEVFVDRSCAGCHTGSGTGEQAGPELAGTDATGSPATLVAAMWNHAPIMKEAILAEGRPWPELSGQDLRDLLAWLSRQGGEP